MGDYGFKYSIGKKSVVGNVDPKQLGYSSKFGTLKTFLSDKVSVAAAANTFTTKEVQHNLNYRPAFNAYFRDPSNGEVYQVESGFESIQFNRSGAQVNVHAKTDNFNITFVVYNSTGSTKNVDIFFEIFHEDLTTEPVFFFG